MIAFDYKKFWEDIEKSGKTKMYIARSANVSTDGMRKAVVLQRLTVNLMSEICNIIDKHPCEYFPQDTGKYPNIVSEPELISYYKRTDERITEILDMRKEEVAYLKGEINYYRDKLQALEESIAKNKKNDMSDKT